jgi:Fur family zinc uptake transcriptional regulator
MLVLAEKPLKAYAIIDEARDLGLRLTASSVYRVLDFLIDCGLAHKVNSLNAFVACPEGPGDENHRPVLLVCPDCQKTMEINDSSLTSELIKLLGTLGFSLDVGAVEVSGLCRGCAIK